MTSLALKVDTEVPRSVSTNLFGKSMLRLNLLTISYKFPVNLFWGRPQRKLRKWLACIPRLFRFSNFCLFRLLFRTHNGKWACTRFLCLRFEKFLSGIRAASRLHWRRVMRNIFAQSGKFAMELRKISVRYLICRSSTVFLNRPCGGKCWQWSPPRPKTKNSDNGKCVFLGMQG
jgi:hypothetical protein